MFNLLLSYKRPWWPILTSKTSENQSKYGGTLYFSGYTTTSTITPTHSWPYSFGNAK